MSYERTQQVTNERAVILFLCIEWQYFHVDTRSAAYYTTQTAVDLLFVGEYVNFRQGRIIREYVWLESNMKKTGEVNITEVYIYIYMKLWNFPFNSHRVLLFHMQIFT
jgi:hypothetical protein